MRAILAVLLPMLMLSACAQRVESIPAPSSATAPSGQVLLSTVLAAPQEWSGQRITLISPAIVDDESRLLVRRLGTSAPLGGDDALWLAEPLPADVRASLSPGSGFLELHGELSPAGAYGPGQRFPYQFNAERASRLEPERSTIANLALNPQALDGILLQLEGMLLAQPDEALLVDEVSTGGVPSAAARQLKLKPDDLDDGVLVLLNRSGDLRWGRVLVVGWWQNGALTPFAIEPSEAADLVGTPAPDASVQP